MKFLKNKKQYIIRIDKGEELTESLLEFCKTQNINSAVITGIGSVLFAEIGFYKLPSKEFSFKKLTTPLEIVSLSGNVTLFEKSPYLHIHCVLSNENFGCFGGHLKKAVVGATCEIYLQIIDIEVSRKQNDEVGLKLLDLD